MKIGDRVSFSQSYGNPVLHVVKGVQHYTYRRRRATGTIKSIVHPYSATEPTVIIKVDGSPQYDRHALQPASKVQVLP